MGTDRDGQNLGTKWTCTKFSQTTFGFCALQEDFISILHVLPPPA